MRLTCLTLFAALLALAGSARADEVVKKNGKSVKGFIVSQSSKIVRIMDSRGSVQRISMSDVESVIEGPETGDQQIDAKMEEIDVDDADELAEIAKWAKGEKKRAWKVVANMALRLDEDQDTAHELLGHVLVGDTWYTSKKKAEAAMKKLAKQIMADAGYVYHRGRYVKKDDLRLIRKDRKAFVEDTQEFEGLQVPVWRDKVSVMTEKGYSLIDGKWVKVSPEDKADMDKFKRLMGDDIVIVSSEHFRIYVMNVPAEEVAQYSELVEKTYDWFLEKMGLEKGTKIFRQNKGHLWVFKDYPTSLEWFKHYRNQFSLSDRFRKLMEGSGSVLSSGGLLSIDVPREGRQRVPHTLVNHAAHFCLRWFSPGIGQGGGGGGKGDPAHWVFEGFGVLAEHDVLGNGVVVHSTLAKYGGSAGRADKRFETKDADDRAEGYAREGDDPIAGIDKLELNSLSGDHIAKAFTIIRWLVKEDIDKFRAWIKERNRAKNLVALEKAFGWSPGEIDSKWRKMALK